MMRKVTIILEMYDTEAERQDIYDYLMDLIENDELSYEIE